ncbi:MAG: hypothetical protein QM759_15030 [Terricaulis sp.]
MSPVDAKMKATFRTVVGSFIAGAGLMVLVGLVGPVAVKGGLTVRDAMAATVNSSAPLIQPLDVAAVRRELASAQSSMDTARAHTDSEIARLDRLSGRQ